MLGFSNETGPGRPLSAGRLAAQCPPTPRENLRWNSHNVRHIHTCAREKKVSEIVSLGSVKNRPKHCCARTCHPSLPSLVCAEQALLQDASAPVRARMYASGPEAGVGRRCGVAPSSARAPSERAQKVIVCRSTSRAASVNVCLARLYGGLHIWPSSCFRLGLRH